MDNHLERGCAYEVHHTVITVIEGAQSEDAAECLARRLLETAPVEPFSITEGAEVFRVVVESAPVPAAHGRW